MALRLDACLLLLLLGTLIPAGADPIKEVPIRLTVVNELSGEADVAYRSSTPEGGVLLGALTRLQESGADFKFSTQLDPNFGIFLASVNGVAGVESDHTYWQILSESQGTTASLKTGVGCYIPKENEHIILRLTTWTSH